MKLIPDIYVRVYVNKFIIRRIGHEPEMEVSAYKPFTTTRLLVGDFDAANTLLRGAIRKNMRFSFLAPRILIQPMEMIEQGLSPVEVHIFKDLALESGGRLGFVWVGDVLTDQQVTNVLNDQKYFGEFRYF